MTAYELQQSVRNVIQLEAASLGAIADSIDSQSAAAVEVILHARQTIITGIGKSGIIARKISATLTSVGFPSVFLHPVEALHGDIGIVGSGDVVMMLSNSGTTPELLTLVPYIKDRGAKVITIVGKVESPLSTSADISLSCVVEESACPLGLAPGNSTTAMLALGDALAFTAMKAKGITRELFAHSHPMGQIGKNLTQRVSSIMHTGERLPFIYAGATFKDAIIEVTKKQLGCVCVVDDSMKLLGIITDGDIRRMLQFTDDFSLMKADAAMTRIPITIPPNALLGEALTIMEEREHQLNVLPVVDESNYCVGLIRIHDIIRSEFST